MKIKPLNKVNKKWLIFTLGSLFTLQVTLYITDHWHLNKAIWYNLPDLDDHKLFSNRIIKKSNNPKNWETLKTDTKIALPPIVKKLKTTDLVIIKNNMIVYEYSKHNHAISNSFSMAKSYVSALIGCAIKDGYIKSIDDPVGKYLKHYKFSNNKELTIKSLLTMSSGLNWEESYQGPFSITTKAYYGTDLEKIIRGLKIIDQPNKEFKYLSGNTQILAMILEKATNKPVSNYLEEKIWKPTQSTKNALWSLDKENGLEKAYCCINADAKNFARLGVLYLNEGMWNNEQILPKEYVKESISPADLINPITNKKNDFYGYQWWIIPKKTLGTSAFYARGILGQFIICLPEKDMVIVRLGKERGERKGMHHAITYKLIKWASKNF